MIRRAIAVCALLAAFVPVEASAARYPNAIEKTVVITGDAAVSMAALFGLPVTAASSAPVRLDSGMGWAVYLLKQDTKEKLYNGDGPPRWNALTFKPGPTPTLALAPFWLDMATALPNSKPGEYTFSSPLLDASGAGADAWSHALHQLKREGGWNPKGFPQFERCFESTDKARICVDVYGQTDYATTPERHGYMIVVVARPA